jgi:hypothetical protein
MTGYLSSFAISFFSIDTCIPDDRHWDVEIPDDRHWDVSFIEIPDDVCFYIRFLMTCSFLWHFTRFLMTGNLTVLTRAQKLLRAEQKDKNHTNTQYFAEPVGRPDAW